MIEAWLSLVERCVRDAEVASSNLVASTHFRFHLKEWPHGQAVKTTPSHGVNSGSIPDKVTKQVKGEPVSIRRRIRLYCIF